MDQQHKPTLSQLEPMPVPLTMTYSQLTQLVALTFSSAPDYENPGCGASDDSNTCVVIVQVSDGSNTDTLTVTATVTDLNEADPVFRRS